MTPTATATADSAAVLRAYDEGMIPLISPRLHAWLDELVPPTYAVAALVCRLHGFALALLAYCAVQHFVVTRITRYPHGTWPLISFPVHARFDLMEGLLLLAGAVILGGEPTTTRVMFGTLGTLQVGAFVFSDTRWPEPQRT